MDKISFEEAMKELERLMKENMDVLMRLKES